MGGSARQCQELAEKGSSIQFKSFKEAMEVALYARKQEIDFIHQQLTTFDSQKDQEWKIALLVHTEKLKEETARFNQLLQIDQLQKREKAETLKGRLEQFELNLQADAVQNALFHKRQEIYLNHQHKLCLLQLMDVSARCEMAQFLTQFSN